VLFDVGHWMSSVESHNAPEPIMFSYLPQAKRLSFFDGPTARSTVASAAWSLASMANRTAVQAFISSLTKANLFAD